MTMMRESGPYSGPLPVVARLFGLVWLLLFSAIFALGALGVFMMGAAGLSFPFLVIGLAGIAAAAFYFSRVVPSFARAACKNSIDGWL